MNMMSKCATCKSKTDKPIVWCEKCWTEAVTKFAEDFCDNYCKYPIQCDSQEGLDKFCANCGLIKLMNINCEE